MKFFTISEKIIIMPAYSVKYFAPFSAIYCTVKIIYAFAVLCFPCTINAFYTDITARRQAVP